jgi:hypothetical protein
VIDVALVKLVPVIVKACVLDEPVTGLGLTLVIVGAGDWTENWYWPEDAEPLRASTLHVAAAVEKLGLITICVVVCELIVRFAYVWPLVTSRSVIDVLLVKFVPVIAKLCALDEPVTGFGLTLVIVGAGDCTVNWY